MNKTLNLTLKKQWYDMTLSGVKKEEYREIKPYWAIRLIYPQMYSIDEFNEVVIYGSGLMNTFKHFDTTRFTNGYSKNAPTFEIECLGIRAGIGKPEWGAPAEPVFIISHGAINPTKYIA